MSWRRGRLGDFLRLKRGHDLPQRERVPGEVPIVSSSGITGFHNEAKARGPGVVTGRYGTLGEVFYVKEDFWPLNTSLYVEDFLGNNPRFSAYFLRTLGFGGRGTAAAVPGVNRNVLHDLEVYFPDLEKQKEIVGHLSPYDDLIENNRRRIQLLEESARLLYREWFVHLRFPGHEHVKIVDGVPAGWKTTTIEEIADTVGGGTPSTRNPDFWEGGEVVWFTPSDLTGNDSLALLDSEKKITQEGFRRSSAKELPPKTILMTSRASIGYFGLYEGVATTNQGFISVIPKDDSVRMYLLYNLISRVGEIESLAGGTTYREINKTTFRSMKVTLPDAELRQEFADFCEDIFQQVLNLKKQNQNLAEARDLVLPRLMNGKIVV